MPLTAMTAALLPAWTAWGTLAGIICYLSAPVWRRPKGPRP